MKKYIIYSFLLTISLFGLVGCEKDSSMDDSKITYYVAFELNGDAQYLLPVGTPYVEPGAKATENGVDVTSKMTISGVNDVKYNKIGLYTITYSAINVDGFSSSATRTVFVYDPTVKTDISGNYIVDAASSYRLQLSNNATIKYSDMAALYSGFGDFSSSVVKLTQLVPGIFSVSDFFGCYYSVGRGYASTYEMTGYVSLTPDNHLELCSSYSSAWNNSLTGLTGGVYDPETKTAKWSASWQGYSFNVVLNKK